MIRELREGQIGYLIRPPLKWINGEKIVRIHIAKYHNFITTSLDPYDATWIANWEAVFAEAGANGLDGRSLLTLNGETMTGRSVVAYGFVNVVGCPP